MTGSVGYSNQLWPSGSSSLKSFRLLFSRLATRSAEPLGPEIVAERLVKRRRMVGATGVRLNRVKHDLCRSHALG